MNLRTPHPPFNQLAAKKYRLLDNGIWIHLAGGWNRIRT